jgi:hypothetical protein
MVDKDRQQAAIKAVIEDRFIVCDFWPRCHERATIGMIVPRPDDPDQDQILFGYNNHSGDPAHVVLDLETMEVLRPTEEEKPHLMPLVKEGWKPDSSADRERHRKRGIENG